MIKTKEEMLKKLNGAVVRCDNKEENRKVTVELEKLGFKVCGRRAFDFTYDGAIVHIFEFEFKDNQVEFNYAESERRHDCKQITTTDFLKWFQPQDRARELVECIADRGCENIECNGVGGEFDGVYCPLSVGPCNEVVVKAKQWLINNPLEVDTKPDGSPMVTYIERAEANADAIRDRLGKASALLEFNDYSSVEKTEFGDGKFKVMGQSMSIDEARELGEWLVKVTKKEK